MRHIAQIIIVILLTPILVFAQGLSSGGDITLTINPEYPDAFSTVQVGVKSFSFDISRSVITWTIDGAKQLYGVGEKAFQFTTAGLGSITRLGVSIITPSGEGIAREIIVRPTSVDILWEAETTAPHWYKGKSLPTPESYIRVTALPHIFVQGARVPSSNLVYAWVVRGKNIASISGYGANTMRFRMSSFFEPNEVSVTASTFDGGVIAQSSVEIPSILPTVAFYEYDTEDGVQFNRAITDNYRLIGNDFVIVTEPFNFDRANASSIEYEWRMNDAVVKPSLGSNRIFFRVPDGTSGTSRIDLQASNPANILQTVKMFFRVVF